MRLSDSITLNLLILGVNALIFSRLSALPLTSLMRFVQKVRILGIILDQGEALQASGIISKSP